LEISGLHVRYRAAGGVGDLLSPTRLRVSDAVLGASLSIAPGETFGLVGESGSGKTSLARAIVGLVVPHAGEIRFRGRALTRLSERALRPVRREIGMMFQDPVASLSPRHTVQSLITEPLRIHRVRVHDYADAARRALALVGLDDSFLGRYPYQLSGGQARRVGAARALVLNPALVIADEPTAGLDVSVQGEILNLFGALRRTHGLAYLIVTHNLPVIRHISDRLGIMYLGRLVEQEPTAEIFRCPAHPYTAGLIAAMPLPDPERRREAPPLEGEIPSLRNRPQGCEFHTRCPFAQPRCRNEPPAYREVAPGRGASCHFPLL
jgi:oligopeptide/dipeptide ABC transporter ATP-binding protein